jgi:hypothetical protein
MKLETFQEQYGEIFGGKWNELETNGKNKNIRLA